MHTLEGNVEEQTIPSIDHALRLEDIASEWMWGIIRHANGSPDALRAILVDITKEELIRFHSEFDIAATELRGDIVEVLVPEESEDGMDDIANWVVSQGFEYYKRVWENPSLIPTGWEHIDRNRWLSDVAGHVFYERFERNIWDYTLHNH
jgi:hypothetical protein